MFNQFNPWDFQNLGGTGLGQGLGNSLAPSLDFGTTAATVNPSSIMAPQALSNMSVDFSSFQPVAQSNGWLGQANQFLGQNAPLINMGLTGLTGISSAFNNFNQNKLAKDALNFQKQQYNTNLANTRKLTNMELSDRQERRVSANPNAESVDSYMKKWGV